MVRRGDTGNGRRGQASARDNCARADHARNRGQAGELPGDRPAVPVDRIEGQGVRYLYGLLSRAIQRTREARGFHQGNGLDLEPFDGLIARAEAIETQDRVHCEAALARRGAQRRALRRRGSD